MMSLRRFFSMPLLLLLLALLVMMSVRIRVLTTPLERDEGEFAYAGQLMLQGIPPYEQFYNMKFPGIYAAYALIMALFGQSDGGIHFGFLLVNLASSVLLYLVARHFLDPAGAAVAAASYVLLSASPIVLGFSAHATQFVVAAALAGLLLLLRAEESGRSGLFFASGVWFGLACLMKQPGALFGMFGFCLLAGRCLLKGAQWSVQWRRMLLLASGGIAPLALTAVILWRAGVFPRFWFWTITYAAVHATELPLASAVAQLAFVIWSLFFTPEGILWFFAVLGMVSLFLGQEGRRKKVWLAGLFVFSSVAVGLSNYLSNHYFVMLLPAVSLLCGQAVSWAGAWLRRAGRISLRSSLPAELFIFAWLLTAYHYRGVFFLLNPTQVSRSIYSSNPFPECREVGRYLASHSPANARIAILGSEPEILFYAHRHAATGYIYMYDFFRRQPYAGQMQHEMIAQIEKARPEYVVYVSQPLSWDSRYDFQTYKSSDVMAWMPKFLHESYSPVGLVLQKAETEYLWDKAALVPPPPDTEFISVNRRRDAPRPAVAAGAPATGLDRCARENSLARLDLPLTLDSTVFEHDFRTH